MKTSLKLILVAVAVLGAAALTAQVYAPNFFHVEGTGRAVVWIADTILPGDRVELFCDGTNWYVSGAAAATGAITFTT